ncbi:MAG: hypothetical protein J6R26_02850 [Paludibacteraceae bacterium]|nr:hypothetical protein [Paludibacteraceae bacterium]
MKTYLLDTIERYKRFSQSLDVKTILCSKAWYVLNEDGDTENLVFQEDGTILVSVNGFTKKYTWKFIPQNKSLNIMHSETEGTMLKPVFMDGNILVFNKIDTKECMYLIDDSWSKSEKMQSLVSVKAYIEEYEKKIIESEKMAIEAQKQEKLAERKRKEHKISELKLEIEETKNQLAMEQSILNEKFNNAFGKYIQHACKEDNNKTSRLNKLLSYLRLVIRGFMAFYIGVLFATLLSDNVLLSILIFLVSYFVAFIVLSYLDLFLVEVILNLDRFRPYWHYKELLKKYEKENKTKLIPFNFKQFKENIEPMIESYKNSITRINDLSNKIYNRTEKLKQISNQ